MLFLAYKRIRGWSGHSTILLLQHVYTGKIVVGSMKDFQQEDLSNSGTCL